MKYTNKTALVTGASSGLGREIAKRLAAEGSNLILVARSKTELTELAAELQSKHNTRSQVIVADLSKPTAVAEVVEAVNKENLSVDILVNNAGFGTLGKFENISPEQEQNMIAVNCSALVGLTHAFIPGMLAKGSGTILNIASTAAYQPLPYFATYAATKAFVLSFSEALWAEYNDRGIRVTAVSPPGTDTGFISDLGSKGGKALGKLATVDSVVDVAMKALTGNKSSYIVGFKHYLMANAARFSPREIVVNMAKATLKEGADN